MKIWKLVSGIISIVLFALVSFQSCAAGLSNAMAENGETGGSGGLILAVMMLTGGIVSIATKQDTPKGADIALIVLFGIAAVIGFTTAGSYGDLYLWAGWCALNAVIAAISLVRTKKENQTAV